MSKNRVIFLAVSSVKVLINYHGYVIIESRKIGETAIVVAICFTYGVIMCDKAIFAGSFDPFTVGHADIALRASKVCSELIIAVARDTGKKNSAPLEKRVEIARLAVSGIKNARVVGFSGLLTDFAKAENASCFIRGLRTFFDFEYEKGLAEVYKRTGGYDSLFLLSSSDVSHVSSTLVRELASLGGDLKGFVTEDCEQLVKNTYVRSE